ncbi:hypothetical protein HDG34_006959 [Paraburkholderia sp. HC6.4b]|uniref:hypothetical protein n=1 Tax=unclassified Paraburkholderia TaxID=2615204 RepID=UPI0016223C59|nr:MULTISPECIES: hypothetical protein [unclassified Paraburkholderia]MBB5412981.1 hypothetical protein [Paraburkholderia sp. HC6.4b]
MPKPERIANAEFEIQIVDTQGWALGMGRVGDMISPFAAGVLLGTGSGGHALYTVFAVPFALAAVAVFMFSRSGLQIAMKQEISLG